MLRLSRPLTILAGLAALTLASAATAQQRTADQVLQDLGALRAPEFDQRRREDRAYFDQFSKDRAAYMEARAALARELFDSDPAHEQVQELMMERWGTLGQLKRYDEVLAETEALAAGDSPLALDAAYAHAQTRGAQSGWDLAECGGEIDRFIARAPGDERGARLLYSAAQAAPEADAQLAIYRRMVSDFPGARATRYVPGKIMQLGGIGKPFELAFQNATDGATIDLAANKGTIYVIDFWATWCGPCVAEMPHMKELYASYRDKGVEFVGVSLDQPEDQGGLQKLLGYVGDHEIAWPQYYQGNGWESEFSTSWGINSIPALFVVDHHGNLHSTSARGRLEEILPALIAQREAGN
ncbi:MAG TPA: TlpA disulfide reductase family protein [Phycisphaerales bacterium]|nr:TlpA disulfide reductase family protein [Phycisphaerales bacterium]